MRYRQKPIEIEAVQFTGFDSYMSICEWARGKTGTLSLEETFQFRTPIMLINTLEGTMAASCGDWIIQDVKGKFYPCKPDIFEATYEAADSSLGGHCDCALRSNGWR